nr:unnamed protein product [Spirometra erinaceieuropaei]
MEYYNLQERYRKEKANDVLDHLKKGFEIDWLRHKALSRYGLVNDDIRVKVWPILAGLKSPNHPNDLQMDVLESHPQANQVELDVRRMASMFPPNTTSEEAERLIFETKRLALSVLHEHPDLHYYQGFHDICYVFLSVLGANEAFAVLNKIVPERFSSFMQKSMDATAEMLQLVFDLLEMTSPDIWSRLQSLQLEPFFTLSWVLTWFTHILSNSNDIHRLYDLFLASDSIMLIYLSVSVRNVVAADFTGNSIVDLLVLTSVKPEGPFEAYIYKGTTKERNFENLFLPTSLLTLQSHGLLRVLPPTPLSFRILCDL